MKIQIETCGEWFYLQSINSVYLVTTAYRDEALSDDNLEIIKAKFPQIAFRSV